MAPFCTLLLLVAFALSKAEDVLLRASNPDFAITDVAKERDKRLLVFSTLDGHLYGVEQDNGFVRWKIKDRAVVKGPRESSEAIVPLFLPNPQDGSLYLIGNGKELLKKLPFTIPELVASAPCRSTDGILYTGKKKDTWFTLDPTTGQRQQVLGWDSPNGPTCPVPSDDAVYIGRTEYSIMMVDSKHVDRRWNVSFYEYTAVPINKETLANYDLAHFTSSSNGHLMTMDRRRASVLWECDLSSPVVSAYILDPEGLISVPFTSLSNNTLNNLAHNLLANEQSSQKLYPTLYIGEHAEGLYALPSYIDRNIITLISPDKRPLLLAGPDGSYLPDVYADYPIPGRNYRLPPDDAHRPFEFQSVPWSLVRFGHYEPPEYSTIRLRITGSDRLDRLITDESNKDDQTVRRANSIDVSDNTFGVFYTIVLSSWPGLKYAVAILVSVGVYFALYKCNFYQNNGTSHRLSAENIVSRVQQLQEGHICVGKIKFKPDELIGKGCDGTFVYRGEFDGRSVAVKRLLPDCFSFADREVSLLRESDAHPNVVRYFCTEEDILFRYIALELCQGTLCDYVDGTFPHRDSIGRLEVLRQATAGLQHLHSLNIVHRDIKPQNVLLSMAGPDGRVRAMISDFGLCKKLQKGRTSFSRRSGVAGTDGWIAPEMLNENQTTTCAVDMFSLGCLYYYVLSCGGHPFGDVLRRQANISSGEWSLDRLDDSPWRVELYKPLIKCLISSQPSGRPSCAAVLSHPTFWNNNTVLAFLQEVSDRIETSTTSDEALRSLERNGRTVVRGNWRRYIDEAVAEDLKKYRSYKGWSLRDLLRALRNKKHHFRELDAESQEALGSIPDDFTLYWTTRFPLLLVHVWTSMQTAASEDNFRQYYNSDEFRFPTSAIDYAAHVVEDDIEEPTPEELIPKRPPQQHRKNFHRNYAEPVQGRARRRRQQEDGPPPVWVLPP